MLVTKRNGMITTSLACNLGLDQASRISVSQLIWPLWCL